MHVLFSLVVAATAPQTYVEQHHSDITKELMDLVALPNVAIDQSAIESNAKALIAALSKRGVAGKILRDPSGAMAVYGELLTPGAARTVVLYAHFDGQNVVEKNWTVTPPFKPLRVDDRIYGRSTSDDKAGVVAILNALEAVTATKTPLTSNIKIFFEGEEEQGSPHFASILSANRELLKSDLWVIFDGPAHMSGRKLVYYGARGVALFDVTVYGPKRPLHSGHYGNWVPNPGNALAKLLASLKDDKGRIKVKGWYDDVKPLTALEKKTCEANRQYDAALAKELLVAEPENAGASYYATIAEPSLNIRGITVAEAFPGNNVVPTEAKASLDARLVVGNDVHRQYDRFVAHAKAQGFFVIDHDPTDAERLAHAKVAKILLRDGGYNADRMAMDNPLGRTVAKAVQSVSHEPIVEQVTGGGSLPVYLIHETLGAPWIGVSFANHDNNQHAENENIRLQNLWDGVDIAAAVMTMER
jgi:acetylornithine deacetylase/succinyl-diaminopimelate desuccinylase-like protein